MHRAVILLLVKKALRVGLIILGIIAVAIVLMFRRYFNFKLNAGDKILNASKCTPLELRQCVLKY